MTDKPPGTFLFRFSTAGAKTYSLSVSLSGGSIGHWRISAEKKGKGSPILTIEEVQYQSFYDISKIHQYKPLISAVEDNVQTLLSEPADRQHTIGTNAN